MALNAMVVALALSAWSGAFTSLFDRHDARVPAAFATVRARYECVTLHGVRIDRSETKGDEATADFTVEATGYLPLTRAEREFPPHWHVHFKRHANRWQVDEVSIPEAAAAQQLADGKPLTPDQNDLVDGELARQLCDLAFATNAKGDYGKASADAQLALTLAREIAPFEAPRALWLIGRAADSAYDEESAAPPTLEAETLAAEYGDREVEARALISMAWIHYSNSDLVRMKETVKPGLQIAEALHDDSAAAEGYMAEANGALDLSDDLLAALHFYEQALPHATKAGNTVVQAAILGNIGKIYDKLANYHMAISYYSRATALYRKAGNTKGVVRSLRNIAEVEQSAFRLDSAERYLREIDELLKKEPNQRNAAYNALTWAKVYNNREQVTLAEKKCLEALAIAKAGDVASIIPHINYLMAELRYKQHRYQDSIDYANVAIADALATPNFDVYWGAKTQVGLAWLKLGDHAKSRAALQEAIDAVELRNSNVPGSGESEQLYWSDKVGVYYAMYRLALAEHDTEEALTWLERARTRTLLASLAAGKTKSTRNLTAEEQSEEERLDAAISSTNVALRDARAQEHPDPASVARIEKQLDQLRIDRTELTNRLYTNHPELSLARGDVPLPAAAKLYAAIPPDAIVLDYAMDWDVASVVVVTRTGKPRIYPLRTDFTKLQKLVFALTETVARRDLDFKAQSRKLYDILIAPVAAELRSKKIVCIVTDGTLWRLPFQALAGPDGRYLIEDHAIFYSPSLTLLSWYEEHKQPVQREKTLLAVAGSGLVDAETEVHRIASLFPSRDELVLTGRRATETRFKEEAGHFRILHLATHGTFEDAAPMYSHLDMARTPRDDGNLEAREIADLDLHADLAVLSSCESGRSPYRFGEGTGGISWALLVAGCPRAVLTQWKIASATSRDLMIDFHRRLASQRALTGRAATEALRRAQLDMLKRSAYAHPFYWSPFILIGAGW